MSSDYAQFFIYIKLILIDAGVKTKTSVSKEVNRFLLKVFERFILF